MGSAGQRVEKPKDKLIMFGTSLISLSQLLARSPSRHSTKGVRKFPSSLEFCISICGQLWANSISLATDSANKNVLSSGKRTLKSSVMPFIRFPKIFLQPLKVEDKKEPPKEEIEISNLVQAG